MLTIPCGRGTEDKRKATGSVADHRILQVESFERNVAARAVGADVFEIAVNDPVVGYGMARAIFQHQQEDSLANDSVFGCCPESGSGTQCGIPVCCIVIRWIDSGRDRGHFRLREFLRSVAEVKWVPPQIEA